MVALHILDSKAVAAFRADTALSLVCLAFHLVGEGSDIQAAFALAEKVGIDAAFVGNILVLHKLRNLRFERATIEMLGVVAIVKVSPIDALHLLAVVREEHLHPIDYLLEIEPQFVGIVRVLVRSHIILDIAVGNPLDGCFEVLLAVCRTFEVVACHTLCRAVVFAEIAFGIGDPLARIDGIAQLLVGQFLASYVDGLEPLQFFAVRTAAKIDHKAIVENALLLVRLEVVEIAHIEREDTRNVLADTDCALLSVNHFVGAVIAHRPIHDVEREVFDNGIDYGIALLVLIDKFALVFGADIEATAIAYDTFVVVVGITCDKVADGYFVKFDIHWFYFLILRIVMRAYLLFPFTIVSFGLFINPGIDVADKDAEIDLFAFNPCPVVISVPRHPQVG